MNPAVLALIIIILVYFLYYLKNLIRFRSILNKFPGRKCNFLLGDVLNFSNNPEEVFKTFRAYAKEFPDGYRTYAAQYGLINFITAEDVEVILSSPRHIEKTRVYELLQPWLGTGLLTSTAEKWAHRRKVLTPAFHFNILRRFIAIFNMHNEKFIDVLKEECNKVKTDLIPLISTLALNIICETSMGIKTNSYDEKIIKYRRAIHRLGQLLLIRTFSPWVYSDFIYNLTPSGREQREIIKILHTFSSEVIKAREKTFNENDVKNINTDEEDNVGIYAKKRFAMLDLLLLAKKEGQIDDEGIREEVDTFMFEGHDTVAMGLSFCLFALANHKDIQEKARAEIDEIFKDSSRPADYRDLQNMQYLEMVIKESLRLYPSVPLIMRIVHEDVPFRGGKYTIPKECMVQIHITDLHRNPKVFPDPDKFDPDRFLPENVKGRHPYAYIPFSAGPRNCIGQKFALLEMKSVLSSILKHYEIDPIDTRDNLQIISDLVLRPKNGLHVKFKPRSR